jgi:hypothetical protein
MQNHNAPGRERTLESLVELVAALDRRVAHAERSSEAQIAGQASQLRAEASLRIEQLQRSTPDVPSTDPSLSRAVMTDDGGPATGE